MYYSKGLRLSWSPFAQFVWLCFQWHSSLYVSYMCRFIFILESVSFHEGYMEYTVLSTACVVGCPHHCIHCSGMNLPDIKKTLLRTFSGRSERLNSFFALFSPQLFL
jgi:hypothetical protein